MGDFSREYHKCLILICNLHYLFSLINCWKHRKVGTASDKINQSVDNTASKTLVIDERKEHGNISAYSTLRQKYLSLTNYGEQNGQHVNPSGNIFLIPADSIQRPLAVGEAIN